MTHVGDQLQNAVRPSNGVRKADGRDCLRPGNLETGAYRRLAGEGARPELPGRPARNGGGWVAVVSVCFCVCARGTVLVSLRGGVGVCGAIGAYVDACTIYQPVRVDTVFVSLV